MKKLAHTSAPVRTSVVRLSLGLALACGAVLSLRASANDDFIINVRSSVDRPYTLFSKKPAVVHSKLYLLAGIKALPQGSAGALTSAVDESALEQELTGALANHGFKEAESGKMPDILITVLYGRSKLKNPYKDPSIEVASAISGGASNGSSPTPGNYGTDSGGPGNTGGTEVSGGMDMLMEEKTPGARAKRLEAENEKVFISISAWEYPGFTPTPKPKLLWRTTVNVNDATLDLNRVAGKMLATGAAYFDKELKEKEISVSSSLAKTTPDTPSPGSSASNKLIP